MNPAPNKYRAMRKNPAPMSGRQLGHNKIELNSRGGRTVIELDGKNLTWAEQRWVSEDLLKKLEHSRNLERRAPLGDKHGSWQQLGEIPTSMVFDAMRKYEDPTDPDAMDKACMRLLRDRDYIKFRADGAHRRI